MHDFLGDASSSYLNNVVALIINASLYSSFLGRKQTVVNIEASY